ncbi:hypothetical protein [Nocardia sp. IFM 10818]
MKCTPWRTRDRTESSRSCWAIALHKDIRLSIEDIRLSIGMHVGVTSIVATLGTIAFVLNLLS